MKGKIRVLVVDDMLPGREGVLSLLAEDPEMEIVGECVNGQDAILAIETREPHLVFLDIEMTDISGFDVLEAIDKEKMPLVIFVTGHEEYARRAFDVHAVDYLSKPYSASRFKDALQRAKHRLRTEPRDHINERTNAFLEERRARYPEWLWVDIEKGRRLRIGTDDIDWIDVANHTVRLHVGEKFYDRRQSLSDLEAQLDPKKFWRIERSYIVNVNRVETVNTLSDGKWVVVLKIKENKVKKLPMSREYRNRLIANGEDL